MIMAQTNDTTTEETDATASNTSAVPQTTPTNPAPLSAPVSKEPVGLSGTLTKLVQPLVGTIPGIASTLSEPVILEEHIVPQAAPLPPSPPPNPDVKAADVGLVLPEKRPVLESSQVTPSMMQMSPQKDIPPLPKISLVPPEFAQKVSDSSVHSTQIPAIPVEAPVGAMPSIAPIETVPHPIADEKLQPADVDIHSDIEKILRQVKLPERRDFKGKADEKPPAPGSENASGAKLTGLVMKSPTDAATAQVMTTHAEARKMSSVHTLKDDLQHAVKDKKMSLVRAVSLEQDKKRTEFIEEDFGRHERRKRLTGILFASFLFFFLGGAALFGVYVVMMSHAGTDPHQQNSIVFAEQSLALTLDNATPSEIKRRIAGERQRESGSIGSITSIVPVFQGTDPQAQPRKATTAEFLKAIGASIPDTLVGSMSPEFFFGLHVVDKNSPVLVIPVTNYERAFAGMLGWETTMSGDLAPAFSPLPPVVLDANGVPSARIFTDDVMRNYDVRELKDDRGQVQLYYSFPSPNLLIIAESPYSFPELLSRLQSVRKL
jgi:hypothetical protein